MAGVLPCGFSKECPPCQELPNIERLSVCEAVASIPDAVEEIGLLGPEDLSYEEILKITYDYMLVALSTDRVSAEMRQVAAEAAINLYHK